VRSFKDALSAAKDALESEDVVSQGKMETLLANLSKARRALKHVHTLESHSAKDGITASGVGLQLKIKGEYETVERITLNGKKVDAGTKNGKSARGLRLDGVSIGSISPGSVIVTLAPQFVDTLENGTHEVVVYFKDGLDEGSGNATFIINRPELPDGDSGSGGNPESGDKPGQDGKPGGGGAGGGDASGGDSAGSGGAAGGGGKAGSSGKAGGSGAAGADGAAASEGASGDGSGAGTGVGGKDAAASAGDKGSAADGAGSGAGEAAEGSAPSPALWIAIAVAAAAAILAVIIQRRKRRES
jgi:hypothetical protein